MSEILTVSLAVFFTFFVEVVPMVHADSPNNVEPVVCNGYLGRNPETGREVWGLLRQGSCPKNHALVSSRSPTVSRYTAAEDIPISGYCCPLPAKDILKEEYEIHRTQCPNNTVATGITSVGCQGCSNAFVCKAINTQRYSLSEKFDGVFWGLTSNPWKHGDVMEETDIPIAIRHGVTKMDRYRKDNGGCLSFPVGGLLVGKSSKRCNGFSFRFLKFKAGQSHSPDELVPMFPECITVLDEFSKSPVCLK